MKKERFVNWWKQDKRYLTLFKAVLMALLPVVCCLVRTAAEGRSIGQVYLPSSEWNDELFYFKQVEGIVNYGFPRGYFGFNESHALELSFAAWSPVLVFPWILWGLLFGWNLMSPVICNIVLLTITMFVFVWLVKPTWKQLGILTAFQSLYSVHQIHAVRYAGGDLFQPADSVLRSGFFLSAKGDPGQTGCHVCDLCAADADAAVYAVIPGIGLFFLDPQE